MSALGSEWNELSPNEREKYTRLSMPSKLGDVFQSPLKPDKRKRQLIKNMQSIVSSTSRSG
jgi:hypothetical protein